MTSLVSKLREARKGPSVILMRYNQRRSAHSGKVFLAVEGNEDILFYQTIITRVLGDDVAPHHFFDCEGKDNVLDLKDSLEHNLSLDSGNVLFFVDRDFDGLKGHSSHARLYVTDAYSIENYLCSRSVVEALLDGEFKCSIDGHEADRSAALGAYDDFVASYCSQFEALNKCLYLSRRSGKFSINTQNSIQEKVTVGFGGISFSASDISGTRELLEIAESSDDIYEIYKDFPEYIQEFADLDPLTRWRGKYLYHVFVKFLKNLVEDRGRRKNRTVFQNRAAIHFEPNLGAVRLFATVISIPPCLKSFLLDAPLSTR